jgi:putative heme iron utilization protein
MKITLNAVVELLHQACYGALATHSNQVPGYPFATVLPFVADEQHCPVFLISSLAEHTKNLGADRRASFLVTDPDAASVLTGARLTLVGDAAPIVASPDLVTRYLRYQPESKQYLELGGFRFFRFAPKRIRLVAGFGQMGWIEEEDWGSAASLALEDEYRQLELVADALPKGRRLLGFDPYGVDTEEDGRRRRLTFADGPVAAASVAAAARARLTAD